MSNGNGEATDMQVVKQGMTFDEKYDQLLTALADVVENVQLVPEISDKLDELLVQQEEILESLKNLGLDGPGFGIERYDS